MIRRGESDHGLISYCALVGGLPGSLPPPGVGMGAGAGPGAGAAPPGAGAGAGGLGAGAGAVGIVRPGGMPPCIDGGGFGVGGNGPRIGLRCSWS